jgi:hypothetical protein
MSTAWPSVNLAIKRKLEQIEAEGNGASERDKNHRDCFLEIALWDVQTRLVF